ncbi:MAG: nucleoside deaminase [Kiloniellaceae bacterium]
MPITNPTEEDRRFMELAYAEAKAGFDEGGLPIGAVMVEHGKVVAAGRNRRVQEGDPTAHGEMDCLRRAGRRPHYRAVTLYTSLSPCMMCAGTIVQFGIPRVVVGEDRNFRGNIAFLSGRGVEVALLQDPRCVELMGRFIREHPEIWNEDIVA